MENSNSIFTEWKFLFKLSGILTVLMLVIIPVQIIIYVLFPMPENTEAWIYLFMDNPLLGILHLDGLYLVNNAILAVIYLAIAAALFNDNKSLILIALMLGLIGTTAYFSSNKCVEMFFLTRNVSASISPFEFSELKQSADILMLEWKGTAFTVYYFLNAVSLMFYTIVMLKSFVFSRSTAVFGLISALLMSIPSTFGTIGLIFSMLSLIPWYIFCIKIASVFLHRR